MHPRWPAGATFRRWIPLLLVACGLAAAPAFAQGPTGARAPFEIPADWLRYRPVIDRFDTLEARGRRAEAWAHLDSLVTAERTAGASSRLIQVLIKRGGTRAYRGDYRRAEPDLREARALSAAKRDTLGEILSTQYLAFAAMRSGDFATARPMWTRMLALSVARHDPSHEGWARMGVAYIDLQRNQPRTAWHGYQRVVALMQRAGDGAGLLEARTGLANALSRLGRIDEAAGEWRRLVDEAGKAGLRATQGSALVNLASAEIDRGDPLLALRYLDQAGEISAAAGLRNGLRDVAERRALLLTRLGRFDDATAALKPTLDDALAQGARDDGASARTLLASIRRAQGRVSEAEQLLRGVRALGDSIQPAVLGRASFDLGSLLLMQGRPREALALLDSLRADARLGELSRFQNRYARTCAMALLDLNRPREALQRLDAANVPAWDFAGSLSRTRAWRMLGRPDSTRACLSRAIAVWKSARERPSDPEWRESYGSYSSYLVTEVLETALAGPAFGPQGALERRAFEQLQDFKAVTLLERMEREPLAPASESGSRAPGLAQLQHVLGDGEVFLDYYVGSRETAVFAVSRGRLELVRLGENAAWISRVRRALDVFSAAEADTAMVKTAADAIASGVWPGLESMLARATRVIVAPAGPLEDVPFALLPIVPGGPALMTRAGVARTPSAAVFLRLRERRSAAAPRALFAFAGERNARGERLTGADSEVRWLARQYAGVDARTSSQVAKTSELVRSLSEYQVLHLAGHATRDRQQPWRSGLLVGDGNSAGDYLRAAEIARLRLPARLAVLSACQSAGSWTFAEGSRGLASAFLSARVPSVVATLWAVRDESAEAFTKEFYPRLARGESVAGALRGAQLALRSRQGPRDPADWAAFVLVGEPSTRVTLHPAGLSPSLHARP